MSELVGDGVDIAELFGGVMFQGVIGYGQQQMDDMAVILVLGIVSVFVMIEAGFQCFIFARLTVDTEFIDDSVRRQRTVHNALQ